MFDGSRDPGGRRAQKWCWGKVEFNLEEKLDKPDNTLRRGEMWQLPVLLLSKEEPLNNAWSVWKTQIILTRHMWRAQTHAVMLSMHSSLGGQQQQWGWAPGVTPKGGQDSLAKHAAQDPLPMEQPMEQMSS